MKVSARKLLFWLVQAFVCFGLLQACNNDKGGSDKSDKERARERRFQDDIERDRRLRERRLDDRRDRQRVGDWDVDDDDEDNPVFAVTVPDGSTKSYRLYRDEECEELDKLGALRDHVIVTYPNGVQVVPGGAAQGQTVVQQTVGQTASPPPATNGQPTVLIQPPAANDSAQQTMAQQTTVAPIQGAPVGPQARLQVTTAPVIPAPFEGVPVATGSINPPVQSKDGKITPRESTWGAPPRPPPDPSMAQTGSERQELNAHDGALCPMVNGVPSEQISILESPYCRSSGIRYWLCTPQHVQGKCVNACQYQAFNRARELGLDPLPALTKEVAEGGQYFMVYTDGNCKSRHKTVTIHFKLSREQCNLADYYAGDYISQFDMSQHCSMKDPDSRTAPRTFTPQEAVDSVGGMTYKAEEVAANANLCEQGVYDFLERRGIAILDDPNKGSPRVEKGFRGSNEHPTTEYTFVGQTENCGGATVRLKLRKTQCKEKYYGGANLSNYVDEGASTVPAKEQCSEPQRNNQKWSPRSTWIFD